ncbi:MAG TPA: hypothetical protein VLT87_11140 [Thermoanaerobaculia bacterium]|nr:hypothetical protein [Thermoanaerobaculia bacterium]
MSAPANERIRRCRQALLSIHLLETGLPQDVASRYQTQLRGVGGLLLEIATAVEKAEGRPTPPAEVVR